MNNWSTEGERPERLAHIKLASCDGSKALYATQSLRANHWCVEGIIGVKAGDRVAFPGQPPVELGPGATTRYERDAPPAMVAWLCREGEEPTRLWPE